MQKKWFLKEATVLTAIKLNGIKAQVFFGTTMEFNTSIVLIGIIITFEN